MYAVWQATIVDDQGNVISGAEIEVRSESSGLLATLYSDRTGTAKSNPFTTGGTGFAQFYVAPGLYRISAGSEAGTQEWRNVRLVETSTLEQALAGTAGVLPDAEQVRRNHVAQVATIADLRALEPAFDGQQVELLGHSVAGVGGGMFYADYSSSAADDNGVTVVTAGGRRWVRKLAGYVTPEMFGAIGNGIADDYAALQAAMDFDCPVVKSFSGTYYTSNQITVPAGKSLIGSGQTSCIITSAGNAGGSFPDGAVVYKAGSAPTPIQDLSANVTKGSRTLSFASAHGLSVGDLILIYNPTDGSWSNFRPEYRAGEYCVVRSVTSTTAVEVENPLFDSYNASDVEVYSCAGYGTGTISGFSFVAPGAGANGAVRAIQIKFCRDIVVDSVRANGSDNASFSIGRCYGGVMSKLYCEQIGANPGFGTQYGLAIANCQNLRVSGEFIGNRHGVTLGGGNDFSVTCRDVIVHDYIARNESDTLPAADWHGNVEHCVYSNGILNNGFNFAGDNNRISGAKVYTEVGMLISGREIIGFNQIVENCEMITGRNDSSRGIIDIGGNSVAISADTKRGGTMIVRNVTAECVNHTGSLILLRNRGFTGDPYSIVADNISYTAPASDVSDAVLRVATVSGDPVARVAATKIDISDGTAAVKLFLSATDLGALVRQDPLSGAVDITTNTSVGTITQAVTFQTAFVKAPFITTAVSEMSTGGDRCLSDANAASATGFNARYRRVDIFGSNFHGVANVKVYWNASINEW